MTTKDQERKALEQIRKIVEGLGPDSYIATAFDGCFEVAEENIENDFACSMKQRVEAVVVENTKLRDKIKALELDVRDLRLAIKKEKDDSSARETALKKKVLSDDDLCDCAYMAQNRATELEERMKKAAIDIVVNAETPDSTEFLNAVKEHRDAKRETEFYLALHGRIMAAAKE